MSIIRSLRHAITSPSSRYALGTLVLAGLVIGAGGVIGFNFAMEATNTNDFCLSCHELSENAWVEFVGTSHHTNASGKQASCADCHVAREFGPKMVRKIRAVGEIYHHLKGTIDTPAKYDENRMWMALKTWAYMNATDSRECRNCHDESAWKLELQSEKAREYHVGPLAKGKTCIDCHKGIAHKLPPEIRADEQIEGIDF